MVSHCNWYKSSATVSFHMDTVDPFWTDIISIMLWNPSSSSYWDYSQIVLRVIFSFSIEQVSGITHMFWKQAPDTASSKEMAQNASANQAIKKEWVKNATFSVFIIQGVLAVVEYLSQGNRAALLPVSCNRALTGPCHFSGIRYTCGFSRTVS